MGKSHWTKRWIDRLDGSKPLLVWDPTLEWSGPSADHGIRRARCFSGVRALAEALMREHVARAVVQSTGEDFDRFCELAFLAGDLVVVIDEAHIYCANGRCPPPLLKLLRVSRHRRVDLIFIAQRPHGLAVDLRTQVTHVVLFAMSAQSSLDWVRGELDAGLADRVQTLKPRQWIAWPTPPPNAASVPGSCYVDSAAARRRAT